MGLRKSSGLVALTGLFLLGALTACNKEPEKPLAYETLDMKSSQEQGPYSLRAFSDPHYALSVFGGLPAAKGAEICSAKFSAGTPGIRCTLQQVDAKKGEWVLRFDEKTLLSVAQDQNLIPGVAFAASVDEGKAGKSTLWKLRPSSGGYAFESAELPAWFVNMYGNTPTRFKTGQLDGRIVVANVQPGDPANVWMLVKYPEEKAAN